MRITLIHALKLDRADGGVIRKTLAGGAADELLDDSLSADLARDGKLTERMTERFLTMGRYAAPLVLQGLFGAILTRK